jgi:menaquinone-dependent protoporphyrinogen IX oxidase
MQALVVYFSLSGRTKLVAETIAAQLSKYSVDIERITFTGTRRELIEAGSSSTGDASGEKISAKETVYDFSVYDLVCIGMPVYGGRPAGIFNAYIKKCKNVQGKKVCNFTTCRFIPGNSLSLMREGLEAKGAVVMEEIAFKGFFRIGTGKPLAFGQKINGSVANKKDE